MSTSERAYYSKIILFGEYSMIFDATALMVPLKKFSAHWQFSDDSKSGRAVASNGSLRKFCQHLSCNTFLSQLVDVKSFSSDLDKGLFLPSNVPTGYGLGSSGTLVAAVFDRYALQRIADLMELKKIFGLMESFFHGSSSGIDPLQCYLGKPFRISSDKGVELLDDAFLKKNIHVCLIDTKIKSNTKPLVEYFKQQRENADYLNRFQQNYVPLVKSCIDSLVTSKNEAFFASLKQLTKGQLEFLNPMITENTLDLFSTDFDFHFGVKISGSGGGGYVLGFTDDMVLTSKLLENREVIWI